MDHPSPSESGRKALPGPRRASRLIGIGANPRVRFGGLSGVDSGLRKDVTI